VSCVPKEPKTSISRDLDCLFSSINISLQCPTELKLLDTFGVGL
jgi:hypothetical protein